MGWGWEKREGGIVGLGCKKGLAWLTSHGRTGGEGCSGSARFHSVEVRTGESESVQTELLHRGVLKPIFTTLEFFFFLVFLAELPMSNVNLL